MTERTEHPVIWLEPWCERCDISADGRQWCQDDVWDACDECGNLPVRYVLAKLQPQQPTSSDT